MDYHECNKEQLIHFCEKLQRKMTKYENRLSGINISVSFFTLFHFIKTILPIQKLLTFR